MKECKFKAGDKVILHKSGALVWEWKDWAKSAGLELGETYTINESKISKGDKGDEYEVVTIVEDPIDFSIAAEHFKGILE